MTKFEKFKTKNIDELAHWLSVHCSYGDAPWIEWFDEKYCKNCLGIKTFIPALGREEECAYCELNDKCKFFPNLDDIPEDKDIIKKWLESEEEE